MRVSNGDRAHDRSRTLGGGTALLAAWVSGMQVPNQKSPAIEQDCSSGLVWLADETLTVTVQPSTAL
jgi:hypothetical protein